MIVLGVQVRNGVYRLDQVYRLGKQVYRLGKRVFGLGARVIMIRESRL